MKYVLLLGFLISGCCKPQNFQLNVTPAKDSALARAASWASDHGLEPEAISCTYAEALNTNFCDIIVKETHIVIICPEADGAVCY